MNDSSLAQLLPIGRVARLTIYVYSWIPPMTGCEASPNVNELQANKRPALFPASKRHNTFLFGYISNLTSFALNAQEAGLCIVFSFTGILSPQDRFFVVLTK